MTRSLSLGGALASLSALALVWGGCSSSEPGPTGDPGGAGGTQATTQAGASGGGAGGSGPATSGGTGSSTAGSNGSGGSGGQATGGQTTGGQSAGGQTTGGQTTGGVSGGNGGAGGSGGGASPPTGPFKCSMYIGAYLSMEWWNAGFQDGVDGDKWQLKWHHHGHVTEWAKADSPFWADTGDPNNDAQGSPIQSPCTEASNAPDRIVFLAISWALTDKPTWVTALKADVANIKAKYPSVKRVDVMTMIRCPMNMKCNPNQAYGQPDSDTNAGKQDCQVPSYVDEAIAQVIAEDPTYVALGPQFEMTMCNPSHDGAHMTGTDNGIAADKMAEFYTARP